MVDLSLYAAHNKASEKAAKANRKAIAKHNHSGLQVDEHAMIRSARRTVNLLKLADKRDEISQLDAARKAKLARHRATRFEAYVRCHDDMLRPMAAKLTNEEATLSYHTRLR